MDNYKWILTGSCSLGSVVRLGLQGGRKVILSSTGLHTTLVGLRLRVWRELISTVRRTHPWVPYLWWPILLFWVMSQRRLAPGAGVCFPPCKVRETCSRSVLTKVGSLQVPGLEFGSLFRENRMSCSATAPGLSSA